jgi:hypothetical protein
MSERDPTEPRDLDARLAALPSDLPPARDLWPGIDAAITPAAVRMRRWPYAVAAGIVLVALGALVGGRMARETAPVAADGRDAGSGSAPVAPRLKVSEDSDYRATRVALEQTYRERLALLAPDTRARIEADLALIRAAHEDIRRALTHDPGSRVLMDLLQSTTEQEFSLYSTVGRSTEPFASRART